MTVMLLMAISLNGIIARENNEEDFLSHVNWLTFVRLGDETGCMIWGRRTHEVVKTWGKEYWREIEKIKKIIVSKDRNLKLEKNYLKAGSPKEALEILSNQGFQKVVLAGGSTLNAAFAKEKLIDEIIFNIEPAVIGNGIPVFKLEGFEDLRLKLIEMKGLEENIIQLHYSVLK